MDLPQAIEHLQAEIRDRTVRKTYRGSAGLVERSAANEY